MSQLLVRDDFRNGVFARDSHKCVICKLPAADAHHILERRLFPDGGYYMDNGASVCPDCHMRCEETNISVEDVRAAAGIKKPVLPPHFYSDQIYDKWGNIVLQNGQRLRGELFYDENVQKVLKQGGVLNLFTNWVKYPRTHHLPWSGNINDDDRVMESLDGLKNEEIVVTEKMDGENTTMYNDHIHARSIDSDSHPSRSWVRNFWGSIAHEIPQGWRICGENLYAMHSILYTSLPTYFLGFSIWNERNICLSWDESIEYFAMLGIVPVPVLYRGVFDERVLRDLVKSSSIADKTNHEGYVVRKAGSFTFGEFRNVVGKFVRKDHVQTVRHWMHGQPMKINGTT